MAFFDKILKMQDSIRPICTVVVPAAGTSRRMGGENKLFMELDGVPVLVRTLQAIDSAELVDEIIVAAQKEMLEEVAELCKRAQLRKRVRVVCGGATRTESVLAAALEASPKAKLIAVHDGARPLVLPSEFDAVIRYACKTNAAAPALPMTDTIKVADETGLITGTPDRKTLFGVQTPQVFDADFLRVALAKAADEDAPITDDCSAVERMGMSVRLVEGDERNIKVTTPLDLKLAELFLEEMG